MSPLRAPLECHFRFFCFPLSHSLFLLCQWVRPFGSSCANKCVAEAITPATPHHTVTVPLLTPFPCSHLCTLLHRAFDRAWCPPPQSTAVSTPATPHHAVTVPLLTPISLFTSMYILASCIRLCLVPAPPKHSGEHSCHAPSHRDGATAHPLFPIHIYVHSCIVHLIVPGARPPKAQR